jgi:hypothetical protein
VQSNDRKTFRLRKNIRARRVDPLRTVLSPQLVIQTGWAHSGDLPDSTLHTSGDAKPNRDHNTTQLESWLQHACRM